MKVNEIFEGYSRCNFSLAPSTAENISIGPTGAPGGRRSSTLDATRAGEETRSRARGKRRATTGGAAAQQGELCVTDACIRLRSGGGGHFESIASARHGIGSAAAIINIVAL
ncbi:hypothetical protein EAG_12967 [Camponotus floridanus]|uniref:Uncharacterized protein n=1 Tax=Camponotus floridanus TaxID=104421 RepID=E2AND2_CAMFO|nr:hypothetical protein EAG_12967 [Camponotus floridanus]